MFESRVPEIVRQVVQDAAISGNMARKEATAKRLAYFQDGQLDYLRAELNRRFAHPEKLLPAFVNVVRKVVSLLASVYAEPPVRTIEGTEQDRELFAEINQHVDAKLKQASRLAKLCKTILLRPVWRGGKMDLDILAGNILDVEVGDSPEDLQRVLITHYGNSNRIEEITYSDWTAETWQRLNYRAVVIESEENPYGVLPFVPVWDGLPLGEFWLQGGDDLIALQEAINLQLTALLQTCEMQGFGVGWVKQGGNDDSSGEIVIGPGSMVALGSDGDLGFASTKAPIADILAVIDQLVKWAAVSNGLPASSLSTKPTDESGVSKQVSNVELQEKRRDDVTLWRRYEHQLFDLQRIIWDTHNPARKFSDKAKLKIDFADPKPPLSEKDQAETWQRLCDLGVTSPVDVAMQRNPDLKTREDALAHLLKIQDENSQLRERDL